MSYYTKAEAEDQAAALAAAAADSPVTQVKYGLLLQSGEWARAAEALGDYTDTSIVLAGSLVGGMFVALPTAEEDWHLVARVLGSRDGQFSYQLDVEGRATFINCQSAASPVVVKR